MRTVTLILVASALLLAGPETALAGCGSGPIIQVGMPSADPEKDTFGLMCEAADVEQTGSIARSARGEILQVGVSTGEAEKDTLGYLQAVSAQ